MIHQNSLLAEPRPSKKSKMYHAIYAVYDFYARPLTDREVLRYMFGPQENDGNKVKPRITEMLQQGYLKECGNTKDSQTGKTVRLVRIKRAEESLQKELF